MFKKIPMGLAALTFFTVGDAEAVQLSHKKHHKHHSHSLTGLGESSVPNCTSYECKNNQVTIGYAGLL
jgi:hypothetical protein